jgi:hypothetical protein
MTKGEQSDSCAQILRDDQIDSERLAAATATFNKLRGYRSLLRSAEQLTEEERHRCPGLDDAITDRAFDAEASTRRLIADGLQTVNELRDTGQLYDALHSLAQTGDGLDTDQFAAQLEKHAKRASGEHGEDIGEMIKEAASIVRETALTLRFSDQRIVLNRPGLGGERDEIGIAVDRLAGAVGRVSRERFFSPDSAHATVWPGRLYLPLDCHHRPLDVRQVTTDVVDAYSGIVSGLASTKGAIYQHARRTKELGHRGMRGGDPVTVVLVAIAVIGVGLIIYGAVTGNGALVAFGAILVIGAALVAFGGFALILGAAA